MRADFTDDYARRVRAGAFKSQKEKMTTPEARKNKDELSRSEAVEVLRGLISTIRLTPDDSGELQGELVANSARSCCLGVSAIFDAH